jgi:hypothetical protein
MVMLSVTTLGLLALSTLATSALLDPTSSLASRTPTDTTMAAAGDGLDEPPWVQVGPTPAAGYAKRRCMRRVERLHQCSFRYC